jgi:hypothetical protein
VNILSEVEYPLRKPDWFSLKTEKDSENSVNLSFSIAVKSLPRKDFWKLLNKGKRKNQSDIGIDKLFDFFKDLFFFILF